MNPGAGPSSIAEPICLSCGEEIPSRARFCPGCGQPVAAPTTPPTHRAPDADRSEGSDEELGLAATVPPVGTQPEAGLPAGSEPGVDEPESASEGERPRGDPLVGQVVAGRYRVEAFIGAGGMGRVYRARQMALERDVVLKFLKRSGTGDEEMTRRFQREALIVSQLHCPNTILLHDFGCTEDGLYFMAMEYLKGRTLTEAIRQSGTLPPLRALAIALQILASLDEAHQKGTVHRDLKPDNIMLLSRGGSLDFVKVLDFGIAKMAGRDEAVLAAGVTQTPLRGRLAAPLTEAGTLFGSPGYMSPEQVLGKPVDHRADLFAVGAILYEMLAGFRPIGGSTLLEVLTSTVEHPVRPLTVCRPELGLPVELDRLILGCLHKDPDRRPSSASDLAARIRVLSPKIAQKQRDQERALLELAGIQPRWGRRLLLSLPILLAIAVVGLVLGLRECGQAPLPGEALGPGERLLVAVSSPRVPAWVQGEPARGVRGQSRGQARRERAVELALAEALARLADLPGRFDGQNPSEAELHDGDLDQVVQHARSLPARLRQHLGFQVFWTKLAVGEKGGLTRTIYEATAFSEPLSPAQDAALRRFFAPLRYDRYAFLTDEAIRRKRCAQARTLAEKVRGAISDLDKKDNQKQQLSYILHMKLASCREADR